MDTKPWRGAGGHVLEDRGSRGKVNGGEKETYVLLSVLL